MNGRPAILLSLFLAGCSNNLNTSCQWPDESAAILNPRVPSDAEHIVRDVELAEELSIRFGDERWAPGPVRARGRQEQCLAPLFEHIAGLHGVALTDLEAARQRIGDRGSNLIVNGPVAIAMILLAALMLRRAGRRFSIAEEPLAVVTATAFCAVLMGGATIGAGRLGEALVETVRLGNGHLSYRGLRLPWAQHSFEYGIVAAVAFSLGAIVYFGGRGQGGWRSSGDSGSS